MVLRRVTAVLKEKRPELDLNVWYLDDGTLVGSRDELRTAIEILGSDEVKALGLNLNLGKCELWWPSGDQAFTGFDATIKRKDSRGVQILRVPVGNKEYILETIGQKRAEMANTLQVLPSVDDAHIEFTLLRACLGASKLIYTLRCLSPTPMV